VTGTTSLQSLSVGAITTPSTIDAMGGIQNSSVHPSFPWIGYPVSINDANGLSVSGPTSMSSNLTVSGTTNLNGQTNVNSNLSVTGNITSTGGIGSFYAAGWTPSSDTIPASSSEVRTASCSSGDYAIECMEWKQSYLVQPRYSYVSSDRCVMQFYNPSGGALYAQVNALCFSPDG